MSASTPWVCVYLQLACARAQGVGLCGAGRTAGTRTGPPRVKRRPAAGSSPSRPRGQANALTRPTAPWAHGGFPVTAATSDPRMRNACHELSPQSGCRAVGAPGRQEHQAAQMRAPLCLLLLLAHAVDMLALHRRKKQGTDVAELWWGSLP